MAQAKHGDIVKIHFMGKLENGTVFDSYIDRAPLQFTIGGGLIIPYIHAKPNRNCLTIDFATKFFPSFLI